MDSQERLDETLLNKEAFYSNLNLKDITNVDYRHEKVFKEFSIKNLDEYYDLYFKHKYYNLHDTLLLVNAFENFRDKCTEIYELHPA